MVQREGNKNRDQQRTQSSFLWIGDVMLPQWCATCGNNCECNVPDRHIQRQQSNKRGSQNQGPVQSSEAVMGWPFSPSVRGSFMLFILHLSAPMMELSPATGLHSIYLSIYQMDYFKRQESTWKKQSFRIKKIISHSAEMMRFLESREGCLPSCAWAGLRANVWRSYGGWIPTPGCSSLPINVFSSLPLQFWNEVHLYTTVPNPDSCTHASKSSLVSRSL